MLPRIISVMSAYSLTLFKTSPLGKLHKKQAEISSTLLRLTQSSLLMEKTEAIFKNIQNYVFLKNIE